MALSNGLGAVFTFVPTMLANVFGHLNSVQNGAASSPFIKWKAVPSDVYIMTGGHGQARCETRAMPARKTIGLGSKNMLVRTTGMALQPDPT